MNRAKKETPAGTAHRHHQGPYWLGHPGAAHKQAQRTLEAALGHGYPADRIPEIQTLLEEKGSS